MQKKQKVALQCRRIQQMRDACENASQAIIDSKMLQETVGVLSKVNKNMPNDTGKLYEDASKLSDELHDLQQNIGITNEELSSAFEGDTASLEEEFNQIVQEVEAEKEEERAIEEQKTIRQNAPMVPVHIPVAQNNVQENEQNDPYKMLE